MSSLRASSSSPEIAIPGDLLELGLHAVEPVSTRKLANAFSVVLATLTLVLAMQARAAAPTHDPALIQRLAEALSETSAHVDEFDTQVWLFSAAELMRFFIAEEPLRLRILRTVYREAQHQRVDPALVLAVIEVESSFDPYAVSRSGAQGLMQVMPFWKRELGRNEDNLIKVDTNVRYGTAILAYYLENAQGDLVRALAGYNGSDGQLDYPDRVLKALRQRWQMDLTENVPALLHSCRAYSLASCTP